MNEFERTVVNEPSVFEPLKFYYSLRWISKAVCINEEFHRKYVLVPADKAANNVVVV